MARAPAWRVALALGAATGLGAMLVLPYALAHMKVGAHVGLAGLAATGLQGALFGFLLAWAGLALGARVGLDAPVLRAWLAGHRFGGESRWGWAALAGVGAAGLIVLLDLALARSGGPSMTGALATGPSSRLKGFLASFNGGVGEEVQLRLFFMTAVVWGLAKVARGRAPWIYVVANVVAALAFGAGHLPLARQVLGALTPAIVARTVLLNAAGGVVFGALYRRWGLEHAMVSHFAADLVLHVALGG